MPSASTSNGAEGGPPTVDAPASAAARTRAGRRAGSLIGQALGDALGFVVETRDAAACAAWWATIDRARAWPATGRAPYAPGQYSDDTQLARELLRSLVAQGRFVPEDYAPRLSGLFERREIVEGGRATAEAAGRLAQGVPWHLAGTPAPAAGNGSAMRAAPIGLLHGPAFSPAALLRDAQDQGLTTHADPRAVAGAMVVSAATAWALRDGPFDARALCEALAGWTQALDPVLAAGLRELPQRAGDPPERMLPWVQGLGDLPAYAAGWPGVSAFVTHSVLWSLYAVLHTPDDPWQALGTALAPGGDVDTTAAMTGAIVGARHGLQAWPPALARAVHDAGGWGHDALVALAGDLPDWGRS